MSSPSGGGSIQISPQIQNQNKIFKFGDHIISQIFVRSQKMTVLSVLRPLAALSSVQKCLSASVINGARSEVATIQPFRLLTTSLVRNGGGHDRTMVIIPSRYQWQKYKDLLHFYIMLGAIPLLGLVFYVNVFIGPATLTEVPCDYHPKHWEHERHPISRFISRHLMRSRQEQYERNLFYITEIEEQRRLTLLEGRIHDIMGVRGDYPNWYSTKMPIAKYLRNRVREAEAIDDERGEE